MSDFFQAMLSRCPPALREPLAPLLDELRREYGGREVYIASSRAQRQRALRVDASRESATVVAARYRVSRRTVQRARHA